MHPEPVDALAAYFGTLDFPQMPHVSICHNFNDKCAGLIGLMPSLAANCSGTLPGTSVAMFPAEKHVIATLFGVDIITQPNYMNETTAEFKTLCPYGSVVPTG